MEVAVYQYVWYVSFEQQDAFEEEPEDDYRYLYIFLHNFGDITVSGTQIAPAITIIIVVVVVQV